MKLTNKKKIIKLSSNLFNRNYFYFDGRASHSIYTLLCILREVKKNKIAIPTIVCQSILSAVIEAGWEPYFCDIDIRTGNVPLNEFKLAYKKGVRFFLHVQLYGNSNNIDKLSSHLNSYQNSHNKLGKSLSAVVNHYNDSSKEFGKIDKDVTKISDGNFKIGIETNIVDRPLSGE